MGQKNVPTFATCFEMLLVSLNRKFAFRSIRAWKDRSNNRIDFFAFQETNRFDKSFRSVNFVSFRTKSIEFLDANNRKFEQVIRLRKNFSNNRWYILNRGAILDSKLIGSASPPIH